MTSTVHACMNADPAGFKPSRLAIEQALQDVDPGKYASTRNFLSGKVTRLSPFLTHGMISLPRVMQVLGKQHALTTQDKLVFEFGWREYYQHVWQHLGGAIFDDVRPAVWSGTYADRLPEDIVQGSTGIPVIDRSVLQLYADGYLHNHARMWLASYIVHIRKIHWKAGADWMIAHLLDGDLASNHLSWQWVAGTFATKPYLFNAENVAKYAPGVWHSPGSVIDASYAELEEIASRRGPQENRRPRQGVLHSLQVIPSLYSHPPELPEGVKPLPSLTACLEPGDHRPLELVHPWALDLFEQASPGRVRVAWLHPEFHERHPWSLKRWRFVLGAIRELGLPLWIGRPEAFGVEPSRLGMQATLNPFYRDAFGRMAGWHPVPRLFESPHRLCKSFSHFYKSATVRPISIP